MCRHRHQYAGRQLWVGHVEVDHAQFLDPSGLYMLGKPLRRFTVQ